MKSNKSPINEADRSKFHDFAVTTSGEASDNAHKMLFGLNGAGVGFAALSDGNIMVLPFAIGTTSIMLSYLFNYIRALGLIEDSKKGEWPIEEGFLFWATFFTSVISGVSYLVGIWTAVPM